MLLLPNSLELLPKASVSCGTTFRACAELPSFAHLTARLDVPADVPDEGECVKVTLPQSAWDAMSTSDGGARLYPSSLFRCLSRSYQRPRRLVQVEAFLCVAFMLKVSSASAI